MLYIHGYALKWYEKALIHEDGKEYYEQFQKGAFSDSIKQGGQKALILHKDYFDIASVAAGTMIIVEDNIGLAFQIAMKNDQEGREIYSLVQRGGMQASVMFAAQKEREGIYKYLKHRTIIKASLLEISLVPEPAYQSSIVRIGRSRRIELLAKIDKILSKAV